MVLYNYYLKGGQTDPDLAEMLLHCAQSSYAPQVGHEVDGYLKSQRVSLAPEQQP